jgi:hypothetical protein
LDLQKLREFGERCNRGELPHIAEGGRIVPARALEGGGRGKELNEDERTREWAEEARPAAGPRQRSRIEAAAPGASPHALGDQLSRLLSVSELLENYPGTRVLQRSSRTADLIVPTMVFVPPARFRIFIELPIAASDVRFRLQAREKRVVPDLRAWVTTASGLLMTSHHRYPDRSVCAYMLNDWILGRDPIHDLVDFCTLWIAKTLHLRFFDEWPGPQHCSARVMRARNKPDEYCWCGKPRRWRNCHMRQDLQRTQSSLLFEEIGGRKMYLSELKSRGLDPNYADRRGFLSANSRPV